MANESGGSAPETMNSAPVRGLYRIYIDCRRMGHLEGVAVATDAEVADAIGREWYLGEVLGKHSEVQGTLEASEIKLLTQDQEFIDQALKLGIVPVGHDVLGALRCKGCGLVYEHEMDCPTLTPAAEPVDAMVADARGRE